MFAAHATLPPTPPTVPTSLRCFIFMCFPSFPSLPFSLPFTSLISPEHFARHNKWAWSRLITSVFQLTSGRPLAERAWFWNWAAREGWDARGPESYLGQSSVVQKHHPRLDKALNSEIIWSLFSLSSHAEATWKIVQVDGVLHGFSFFHFDGLARAVVWVLPLPPRC